MCVYSVTFTCTVSSVSTKLSTSNLQILRRILASAIMLYSYTDKATSFVCRNSKLTQILKDSLGILQILLLLCLEVFLIAYVFSFPP